jgi:hypothetical protein
MAQSLLLLLLPPRAVAADSLPQWLLSHDTALFLLLLWQLEQHY